MNYIESEEHHRLMWYPFEYHADWGIPRRWREEYSNHIYLGRPTSPELDHPPNGKVQHFALGSIIWWPDNRTELIR